MVSNKLTVLAASAALLESALGAAHGHQHKHLNKRVYETDWVTEVVTVWVTPKDGDALPASCTGASSASAASAAGYDTPKAADTTISTSIVVSTSAAYNAAAYTTAQTTLSTAVKSVEQAAPVYSSSSSSSQVVVVASSSSVYQAPVASTTTSAKASTTTTTTESTGSSSAGSAGLSHKRGLAYNDASLANTFQSSCTNCGWGYNWASYGDNLDSSLQFIPQLWSTNQADVWSANATAAINSGSKALFSFNEPDISGQALMSVSDCAAGHVEYMNPFKGKALIGAPAVSNSGSTNQGLDYLEQWINTCKGLDEPCHYDFCNIHWYSAAQYSDTLFTQIEKAYKLCGKPIWLTEFAPTDTDTSTINSFLEEVIPKLEAIDYLEGYAYFMVKTGVLMDSASILSTYGQTYASASA